MSHHSNRGILRNASDELFGLKLRDIQIGRAAAGNLGVAELVRTNPVRLPFGVRLREKEIPPGDTGIETKLTTSSLRHLNRQLECESGSVRVVPA